MYKTIGTPPNTTHSRRKPTTEKLLLIGIGLLWASVYLMAVEFPERKDELYALHDAVPCQGPPQRPADCLWDEESIVSDVRL
ncbi:hypothetical protein [Actinomadura sp. 3N407]|uniref:hypothetical protein n=1 Tax=Actinomadura sp. 3N407 TaxID=3457423 RepID=UPI003FCE363B